MRAGERLPHAVACIGLRQQLPDAALHLPKQSLRDPRLVLRRANLLICSAADRGQKVMLRDGFLRGRYGQRVGWRVIEGDRHGPGGGGKGCRYQTNHIAGKPRPEGAEKPLSAAEELHLSVGRSRTPPTPAHRRIPHLLLLACADDDKRCTAEHLRSCPSRHSSRAVRAR